MKYSDMEKCVYIVTETMYSTHWNQPKYPLNRWTFPSRVNSIHSVWFSLLWIIFSRVILNVATQRKHHNWWGKKQRTKQLVERQNIRRLNIHPYIISIVIVTAIRAHFLWRLFPVSQFLINIISFKIRSNNGNGLTKKKPSLDLISLLRWIFIRQPFQMCHRGHVHRNTRTTHFYTASTSCSPLT